MPTAPITVWQDATNLTTANGFTPQVVAFEDGGFLVAWTSNSTTGPGSTSQGTDVIAQRFDALGNRFDTYQVNFQFTANDEEIADLTRLPSNGYAYVYSSFDSDGVADLVLGLSTYLGVTEQILTYPGVPSGIPHANPEVAVNSEGAGVVVYEQIENGLRSVRTKIFTSDNVGSVNEYAQTLFFVNNPGEVYSPDVAALTGGGFVITAIGDRDEGNAIIFNLKGANGASIISMGIVNHTDSDVYSASNPQVTGLTNGNFVITYDDYDGVDGDVVAVLYDNQGNQKSAGVAGATGSANNNDNRSGQVIALLDGGFLVVLSNRIDHRMEATSYDATGALVGNFIFGSNATGAPDLAMLTDGRVAVTWYENPGVVKLEIIDPRGAVITIPTLTGVSSRLTTGIGSTMLEAGAGNDTVLGQGGDDVIQGRAGSDTLQGGDGDDQLFADKQFGESTSVSPDYLFGEAGADTLTGAAGADTLDGGQGADILRGGLGNDTYYVDNAGDQVIENANAGTDTVFSTVTFNGAVASAVGIENIILTGSASINTAGNGLDNTLTGNSGNNGLNGGAGADRMVGGLGNDTYTVDNAGDVVVELAGQGTDLVRSSVAFDGSVANAVGIENITLTGSANINTAGNALNNIITGNSGNNGLNGGKGNDTLIGGLGNDVYSIDSTLDVITELANQGTDTVRSAISFTLSANLENLTLVSTKAINGIGNDGANTIIGGDGDNIIAGKGGADLLRGGGGSDTFDYNAVSESSYSVYDRIFDLTNADKIDLSGIDANTGLAGNQAFVKVAAFTHHAGEITLAYNAAAQFTVLSADVNGDGVADMRIVINGDHHTFTNFVF